MIEMLKRRREDGEEGFTLIELMVVVLIIAILIAIAIPTFLGAQNRARDRAAQSNLRNSLTAAKTIATDAEGLFATALSPSVVVITPSDMNTTEPSITHAAAGAKKIVGVKAAADGKKINLWTQSASDTWFGIQSTSTGSVTYCKAADSSGAPATALDGSVACALTQW